MKDEGRRKEVGGARQPYHATPHHDIAPRGSAQRTSALPDVIRLLHGFGVTVPCASPRTYEKYFSQSGKDRAFRRQAAAACGALQRAPRRCAAY